MLTCMFLYYLYASAEKMTNSFCFIQINYREHFMKSCRGNKIISGQHTDAQKENKMCCWTYRSRSFFRARLDWHCNLTGFPQKVIITQICGRFNIGWYCALAEFAQLYSDVGGEAKDTVIFVPWLLTMYRCRLVHTITRFGCITGSMVPPCRREWKLKPSSSS